MTSSLESEKVEISGQGRNLLPYILGCVALAGICGLLVVCIALVSVFYLRATAKPVEVNWLVGLGAGSDPDQLAPQQEIVDEFNASQTSIHLNLEVIPYDGAVGELQSKIKAGNAPDLVGPLSFSSVNRFSGQWLPLDSYIRADDLKPYNSAVVKIYQTDEGQMALPFMVFPSALYYNWALFDAAGLAYPPAHYGEKYKMPNGTEVEWTWDALADIARLLTVDQNGRNATEAEFDRDNVDTYGYTWTFELHPHYIGSYFGSGSLVASDGKTAQIPPVWHAAWAWTSNGITGDQPFIANGEVGGSAPFNGNGFNSGKVAMTIQPSWYTCCLTDLQDEWDLAAVPSYQGKPGGRVDVDTFYITKASKNPAEAYQVMQYLLTTAAEKLTATYGGMAANTAVQQNWVKRKKVEFPSVTHWDVLVDGLNYPDLPHAESNIPSYRDAFSRGDEFSLRLFSGDFDLADEEERYLEDLNAIFASGN